MPRFAKLLIANRGEIAARIARTARSLGYRTVAVYSDADRDAPHVAACDEAVRIGEAPSSASYLSIERIVAAAKRCGADAIHPGYGFLSENAGFAEACAANGIVFIGPPAAAIHAMGNKAAAKARMLAAGVPCIPGYAGEQDAAAFVRAAQQIGYPVMLKAAAGGGGKGMRVVASESELDAAFATTRLEAERAFGSGELLLEKALVAPRHIEIQIFADAHGGIVHLGERDCSIQRRHQKVIEESPSPAVGPALRAAMGEAAIAAARAVDYVGAGTIEFLLDDEGAFYFLEMNTRLQVEHAVTEATHGIDLVAWQLRVAAGDALEMLSATERPAAHAIEARLYAEDPAHGFLPQAGRIVAWTEPKGDGVRVDAALCDGLDVSPYYDPMLAKIVGYGSDRAEARRRLVVALEDLTLFGIATNRRFLIDCLEHEAFVSGNARTDFIATHFHEYGAAHTDTNAASSAALALAAVLLTQPPSGAREALGWESRGGSVTKLKLRVNEVVTLASLTRDHAGTVVVTLPNGASDIELLSRDDGRVRFRHDGVTRNASIAREGNTLYVRLGRDDVTIVDATFEPSAERAAAAGGATTSPMPGIVAKVAVSVGDDVVLGQTLVVLEAMKMLHEVSAGATGRVAKVLVAAGQQVGMRAVLVEIEPLVLSGTDERIAAQ